MTLLGSGPESYAYVFCHLRYQVGAALPVAAADQTGGEDGQLGGPGRRLQIGGWTQPSFGVGNSYVADQIEE